jgi:hypothetical protein
LIVVYKNRAERPALGALEDHRQIHPKRQELITPRYFTNALNLLQNGKENQNSYELGFANDRNRVVHREKTGGMFD